MKNIFFVPECSQAVAHIETEDKIKKLIRDAEKDERILGNLSTGELNDLLNHLSLNIRKTQKIIDEKQKERAVAERQIRKIYELTGGHPQYVGKIMY